MPVQCPLGQRSPAGAVACTPCPAGHFDPKFDPTVDCSSPETLCPGNTWCSEGSSAWTPCAAGTADLQWLPGMPRPGRTDASVCVPCPEGQSSTGLGPDDSFTLGACVEALALSSLSVTPSLATLVALAGASLSALSAEAAQALRADVAAALGIVPSAVVLTSLYRGKSGTLVTYNVGAARQLQGGGAGQAPAFPPGFTFPASLEPLAAYSQQDVTVVGVVAGVGSLAALPALAARLRSAGGASFPLLQAALADSYPNVSCSVDAGSVKGMALSSAVLPGLGAQPVAGGGAGPSPGTGPSVGAVVGIVLGLLVALAAGVCCAWRWCCAPALAPPAGGAAAPKRTELELREPQVPPPGSRPAWTSVIA